VPHVIVTEGAAEGLKRCWRFLAVKAPNAARRAGQAIERQFLLLETFPDIGRPFPEMAELLAAPDASTQRFPALPGRHNLHEHLIVAHHAHDAAGALFDGFSACA